MEQEATHLVDLALEGATRQGNRHQMIREETFSESLISLLLIKKVSAALFGSIPHALGRNVTPVLSV